MLHEDAYYTLLEVLGKGLTGCDIIPGLFSDATFTSRNNYIIFSSVDIRIHAKPLVQLCVALEFSQVTRRHMFCLYTVEEDGTFTYISMHYFHDAGIELSAAAWLIVDDIKQRYSGLLRDNPAYFTGEFDFLAWFLELLEDEPMITDITLNSVDGSFLEDVTGLQSVNEDDITSIVLNYTLTLSPYCSAPYAHLVFQKDASNRTHFTHVMVYCDEYKDSLDGNLVPSNLSWCMSLEDVGSFSAVIQGAELIDGDRIAELLDDLHDELMKS